MTKLSLFSGIGGDDLASEWAGIKTVCFVEKDKFCQSVLRKHWPGIPIIGDVHEVTKGSVGTGIDIIAGGFPCQDISIAHTRTPREGLDGERSGLWREYKRLVTEIRPRFVVVENVAALLRTGLGQVLGDLCEVGYDAEWLTLRASDFGAPHKRERVFVVAYPRGQSRSISDLLTKDSYQTDAWHKEAGKWGTNRVIPEMGTETLPRLVTQWPERYCQPELLRISDGISSELDRLRTLGNAVVPQQIYPIYKAIVDAR